MVNWKLSWCTVLWIVLNCFHENMACLSREQFLAAMDPKTTLMFEARLLQPEHTERQTEAYVRVTRILSQPETGWQLQPNNVAHLVGIRPRPADSLDCLPTQIVGNLYLWIVRNSPSTMRSAENSLELIPGGLFSVVDELRRDDEDGNWSSSEKEITLQENLVDVVKGGPIPEPASKSPCDSVNCQYGSVCELWPSRGSNGVVGVCVCPQADVLYRRGLCNPRSGQVCAHNGRMYENECALVLAGCVQQTNLERIELPTTETVTARALCEQLAKDRSQSQTMGLAKEKTAKLSSSSNPVDNTKGLLKSQFEEKPQQDAANALDQRRDSSVEQINLPDSTCDTTPCANQISPVCGTDGVTYQNECLLRQRSCLTTRVGKPAVRINYATACRSSQNSVTVGQAPDVQLCASSNLCLYGGLCPIQRKNPLYTNFQPWFDRCTCGHINCLGHGADPVCANDGQTYSNECFLQRRICETQIPRQVLYRGNCASNPCLGHTCRWAGERCQVDESGQPKCVCPDPCPNVVMPVCGSDQVTYDSHCHLERTACIKMRDIFVLYAGQCSEEPHCEVLGLRCQGYEVCSRVLVPNSYSPVLGYAKNQNPWSDSTSTIQPTGQLVSRCLCPTCPEKGIGDQVCGTDGQTYRSECHLRASACQRQLYQLKVKARGPCDACKTKDCPYHAICRLNAQGEPECICPTDCLYVRKPVCGTDGKMYENECFLKVAACAEQRDVLVAQEGPCATCPLGCPLGYQCLKGECVCRDTCPKPTTLEAEVCGSDGQLYPSECELKRQACLRQTNVRVDPSGARCRDLATSLQINNSTIEDGYHALPQSDETGRFVCSCNKIGALSEHCDHRGRCHCKWGVRGQRCDQCMPDYWGIQNGHECIACSCHPDGALNTTCDPLSGQCRCRPGIFGRQCSICPDGGRLTKSGCIKTEPEQSPELNNLKPEHASRQEQPSTMNDNARVNGRQFTGETTLLVRAPFPLKDPFLIQLVFHATKPNGTLLYYRLAPSRQEQMLVENPIHSEIFLSVVNERIELRFVDGQPAGRTLIVRSSQRLQLGVPHTLRAGVSQGQPWIKLNADPQTTLADIEQHQNDDSVPSSLSTGGSGTIVIGREVLRSSSTNIRPSGTTSEGFTGCLLQVILQTGSPPKEQEIDLISGDKTELAWIGVKRLPSGLAEAPLCRAVEEKFSQPAEKQRVQSDGTHGAGQSANPCDRTPCWNGAMCVPQTGGGHMCICQPGWQGDRCDHVATIVPQFHGNSFIRLPGPSGSQAMNKKRLRMELIFLITDFEGVIFVVPPPPSSRAASPNVGPFIGAYVDVEGYLYVVCRTGNPDVERSATISNVNHGDIVLRYSIPIRPRMWHTLTIEKRIRALAVQVDNGPKQRVRTVPENFRTLPKRIRNQITAFNLLDSPIYVGGFSSNDASVPTMKVRSGMKGALQKININEAEVVLAGPIISNSSSAPVDALGSSELWINVTQWQGPPCGPNHSPCQLDRPDSICRPQGSIAACACSTPLQLWQLLREKPYKNVEDAERIACNQRQLELENARTQALFDRPILDESTREQVQYDAIPSLNLDSKSDQSFESSRMTSKLPNRCGRLTINFKGETSLAFHGLIEDMEDYNLRLRISTGSADGLLLLISANSGGRSHSFTDPLNADQTEITVLELRRGYVEYSIHVPNQLSESSAFATAQSGVRKVLGIRSNRTINDENCHTIHIARSPRRGTLIVDHHTIVAELKEPSRNFLPNNILLLGGTFVNISGFPNSFRNFTGCVGDVFVNEHNVQLLTTASELRGPIQPCQ